MVTLLSTIEPDEVYNLAAQSHVRVIDEPVHTPVTPAGDPCDCRAVRLSGHTVTYQRPSEMSGACRHRRTSHAVLPAVTVWRRQGLFVPGDPHIAKRTIVRR